MTGALGCDYIVCEGFGVLRVKEIIISFAYLPPSFTSLAPLIGFAYFSHFFASLFLSIPWLIVAVLSFNMRFLNSAALLALPFLTSAAPIQDAKSSKGYQMGAFYVNWVRSLMCS